MVIRATPKPVVPLVPAPATTGAPIPAQVRVPVIDGAAAPALPLPESEPLEGTIEPERLATVEKEKRLEVFSKPGGLDAVIEAITIMALKHKPDVTTDRGRKALASVAYKIAQCKTRLDDAGKELVDDLKALPKAVDANRKAMRDRLDALKDRVRKPLTDWEADQERQRQFVADIQVTPMQLQGAPAALIQESIEGLKARDLSQAPDWAEEALRAQQLALKDLEEMLAARKKADADAAELARLREAQAERERQEAEEKRLREVAENARREAEAQAQREKDEAQRKTREAQEAAARAEQAQKDAEADAEKARKEADAKAEAAVAAERQRQA
ncbi:MAG TPA: hypothetical protein VK150_09760, partial [Geothrix sp.]|nr:hypothetical protein [Geothrix sp.]